MVSGSVLPADARAKSRPAWATAAVTAGLVLITAVVANAAGAQSLLQAPPARPAIAQSGGVTPLFRLRGMTPGRHYTACVDVAVHSPGRGARVFLAGQDVRGELAPALQLAVVAGPATGPARCSAFNAPSVYRGTVAALGTKVVAPTGWSPRGDATWRFRFTVWAAADAPSAAFASVGFVWHLSSVARSTPVPVSPTTPRPKSAPRVVLGSSAAAGEASFLSKLARVFMGVLRHPVYPSVLFAIAALFVLLQGVVDRRDPKLALAPLRNDDLHFTLKPRDVPR